MCGIIGFVNASGYGITSHNKARFIEQGLIVNTLRGDDGAGAFFMQGKSPSWVKIASDGYSLTINKVFTESRAAIDQSWFCAAHNRSATVGKLSLENTHPFCEGPVTMIHNGTLTGDGGLGKKQKDLGVEVDSHALCHNLAATPEAGAEVSDMLSKVNGAFALAWYDERDGSFNLARNAQRPLHVYSLAQKGSYLFASEAEMLDLLVARLRMQNPTEKKSLPVGEIWKFKKDTALPEVIAFKPFQETYSYNNWRGGYGGYGRYDWDEESFAWAARGGRHAARSPQTQQTGTPALPAPPQGTKPAPYVVGNVTRTLLQKLHLSPSDTLLVSPLSRAQYVSPSGCQMSCVIAHCRTLDRAVMVRSLSKTAVDNMWNNVWQVKPVGVYYALNGDGKEVPTVLAAYTGVRGHHLRGEQFEKIHSLHDKEWRLYTGPNGVSLTYSALQEYLIGGCAWCGKTIPDNELSKVSWFGETPVCGICHSGYQHAVEKVRSIKSME